MARNYTSPLLNADFTDAAVAIVATSWNNNITHPLAEGAEAALRSHGVERVDRFEVPGAIELTYAAQRLVDTDEYDAVIVCGCVIKGDTSHFDYVCRSVTQGITEINANADSPVIFGVLTVNDLQQALDRLDKGAEFGETALAMIDFKWKSDF